MCQRPCGHLSARVSLCVATCGWPYTGGAAPQEHRWEDGTAGEACERLFTAVLGERCLQGVSA